MIQAVYTNSPGYSQYIVMKYSYLPKAYVSTSLKMALHYQLGRVQRRISVYRRNLSSIPYPTLSAILMAFEFGRIVDLKHFYMLIRWFHCTVDEVFELYLPGLWVVHQSI